MIGSGRHLNAVRLWETMLLRCGRTILGDSDVRLCQSWQRLDKFARSTSHATPHRDSAFLLDRQAIELTCPPKRQGSQTPPHTDPHQP